MPKIGVIGGSGLYDIPGLRVIAERAIATPYGEPSARFVIGEIAGVEVAFLPRHGVPHHIAPHKINYRANIMGFKSLGVERIISVSATGGINPSIAPGEIVLLDQVIDTTQGMRQATFYDEDEVVHIDFTEPYCPELRGSVTAGSKIAGLQIVEKGTYVCVNGPRLESKAEIRLHAASGGDVIGMTGMPEAALARELEICFSGICLITNYAAGVSTEPLSATEVVEKMKESGGKIKSLLKEVLKLIPLDRNCPCKDSLKDAKV